MTGEPSNLPKDIRYFYSVPMAMHNGKVDADGLVDILNNIQR